MTRSTSRKPPGLRRLAAAVAAGLLCAGATLFVTAAPAAAKASLKVSKTTGLKDGDSITVTGTGFTKGLTDLALGQCVKNPTGPTDCNLSGGAVFAKTDSSGKTEKVTLKLSKSFNGKECGTDGCVIAAQLLPSAHDDATVKANAVSVKIVFGSSGAAATTPASTKSTSAAAAATTAADDDALPKTGPGMEWATVVLIGTGLLLPGFGLLAMLPARRRRMAGFH